jgi:phosphoglycerate kinase
MTYKLPDIRNADVQEKSVFARFDLDVPIKDGQIQDDTRLKNCLETFEFLLKNRAKLIIAGHLGRPEKDDRSFSLRPVGEWFRKQLEVHDVLKDSKRNDFEGFEITEDIFLLENLRFYKGEEENDQNFADKLSKLSELYVNEAFASSHRDHASIVSVPKFLPHFAGIRFQSEVLALSKVLEDPKRPLVVIIGGAKIDTKLPLISKMHKIADYILVGGEIVEQDKILNKITTEDIKGEKAIIILADLNSTEKDISLKSLENFLQIIDIAKTIVWNGPLGFIEDLKLSEESATKKIAEEILKTNAYSVVGGGDTISFLRKFGLVSKFSFVSTGGGAMLAFLSGEKFEGLEALLK